MNYSVVSFRCLSEDRFSDWGSTYKYVSLRGAGELKSEDMKYARRLDKARNRIREWQDSNTGSTNKQLDKRRSLSVLNELCPWCEFDGRCELNTKMFNKSFKKCWMLSSDLEDVWILTTDEKNRVEIGRKYGKLTVKNRRTYIAKPFLRETSATWWVCVCDCGNFRTVRGHDLTTRNTQSCGCARGNRYSRVLSVHTIYSEKRKSRYRSGSATNPDGSHHVWPTEMSSRIGQAVDVLIISSNPEQSDYYIHKKCQRCTGTIRINEHDYHVCDRCGLCH
jgi:hypothetical protein